jgi:hypothetical protein
MRTIPARPVVSASIAECPLSPVALYHHPASLVVQLNNGATLIRLGLFVAHKLQWANSLSIFNNHLTEVGLGVFSRKSVSYT